MASRKRRKSQSRKSKSGKNKGGSATKWLLYGGGLLLFLMIIGLIFAYNSVRSYLRSDEFRVMLGEEAGYVLNGDAKFSVFQWDGWDVKTEEFSFQGKNGIQNLNARGIDAQVDIGAAWGGVYRIDEVRLREVELLGDFREESMSDEDRKERPKKEEGFFDRFLPDSLEVTAVDIASINGRAMTDNGNWAWKNTSAKVRPGSTNKVYDLEFNGGEISTPLALVDRLSLKMAKGRYSGDQFFLLSSDFDILDKARLTAEGDFGIESKAWQFRGNVTGAQIEEIVAEDWKQRLMGPLELSFEVSGQPEREVRISGDLEMKDGVLTALPLLDRIAAYANTTRFRRLALSEASLEFEKLGDRLELNNIILASEGLVRLEGSMVLDGDVIRKGEFRLGITPGTLGHIPGAETKVFQRGDLGLLWTPLKVSGTLDSPQEDLSDRLIEAAGERMFELLPESGQYALKYSGKAVSNSTKAIMESKGVILDAGKAAIGKAGNLIKEGTGIDPEAVIEGSSDAINKGTDAIKEGVGTLFDIFGRPIKK